MKAWIMVLAVWLGPVAWAAPETHWLQLAAQFRYQEKDFTCTTGSLGSPLYLAIESEAGHLVSARLARYAHSKPAQGRPLTATEWASLETHGDHFDRIWVKALVLEDPTAIWLANEIGNILCAPKKKVESIEKTPVRLEFETEGLGDEYLVSPSNALALKGIRKDGVPFELELQLIQKFHSKEIPQ